MSDHIEAMAREWVDGAGSLPLDTHHPDIQRAIRKRMADVWAAGIGALIAHEPCGGTNRLATRMKEFPFTRWDECPGPHTVIDKGDDTKLYAGLSWRVKLKQMERRGQLPSEWRIE